MQYYDLLERVHEEMRPRTYVEVGVRNGQSMAAAREGTLAIGIDPELDMTFEQRCETKLYKETSDQFFATHDLRAELGGRPVELAFIDGMHHFEFALRDFVNLERACERSSTILVHDCLPLDAETSARERTTVVWSGDVWKLVVCLRTPRPDLQVVTVDVPPTGMAFITNLDPTSDVLGQRLEDLYAEYIPMAYDDLERMGKDPALTRVGHDWDTVRGLLKPGWRRRLSRAFAKAR